MVPLKTIIVISTALSALMFTMMIFNYNCLFTRVYGPTSLSTIDKLNITCIRTRLVLLVGAIFLLLSMIVALFIIVLTATCVIGTLFYVFARIVTCIANKLS